MKKVMNYLRKRFEKICLLVSTFFSILAKMQFFGIARKIYTALIGLPSDKCSYKTIISCKYFAVSCWAIRLHLIASIQLQSIFTQSFCSSTNTIRSEAMRVFCGQGAWSVTACSALRHNNFVVSLCRLFQTLTILAGRNHGASETTHPY